MQFISLLLLHFVNLNRLKFFFAFFMLNAYSILQTVFMMCGQTVLTENVCQISWNTFFETTLEVRICGD